MCRHFLPKFRRCHTITALHWVFEESRVSCTKEYKRACFYDEYFNCCATFQMQIISQFQILLFLSEWNGTEMISRVSLTPFFFAITFWVFYLVILQSGILSGWLYNTAQYGEYTKTKSTRLCSTDNRKTKVDSMQRVQRVYKPYVNGHLNVKIYLFV
jgi:hypothetical protein